jgi:pyruvate/2-oxoglutarate dehydrogenase complex dihydrolipoamide acyltransferase (E2) component
MTEQDPKAELAAVRAQLAAIEQARQERDKDPAVLLAKAKRQLADEMAIADAERVHGAVGEGIACVYTPKGVVIVKRPHHLIFRRFADSGELTTAACEKLIGPCLVHPSKEAFEDLTEEFPGVIATLAALCTKLAGVGSEQASGK